MTMGGASREAAVTCLLTLLLTGHGTQNVPTTLAGNGECRFPGKQTEGTPWPLQRILLDELWQDTKGAGVRVAVIDSGVDDANPQLSDAVDAAAGRDFVGTTDGTVDEAGHGTKVAGIIAARPRAGTGFVGLAPEAVIIPIRQTDGRTSGATDAMAEAIDHAVAADARVVNISQDTSRPLTPDSPLGRAVARAIAADVVVVASAGNDGKDGRRKNTYPAAFPGVLAVAASDRNDERAPFSQSGGFVGVAAPGVDVVSTVPGGGQCVDSGTSFSAPYVTGIAALLRAKYPTWKASEVVDRIRRTAVRATDGRDDELGWGVADPVRALEGTEGEARRTAPGSARPDPAPLSASETRRDRDARVATYAVAAGGLLVALVAGTCTVLRDGRRLRCGGRMR
ncbi:type VII secretion-associated serine protease mycosin [Streptomyces sp. HUAS YS2]|uniref:Type VII secretion-associated serine protease mycosin n=2 Tax=Streptomyces solicathayae TaxID=3081768 RepID=A0ABZ0LR14_9ACTN|nr:type VII secretion-associated serine protease mycosin [Streptomyces sp. HUAS YS2]WOX21755.1 type VII secretion-associated serine protease mycosin [Streptomyces sp. HUAS YS2]